ncbi:MAG TPA: hypothetical protein VN794_15310, partial [Methylomirabilota bacterium]|nr:hypothetical protein [Methylomirabilota bacterium]
FDQENVVQIVLDEKHGKFIVFHNLFPTRLRPTELNRLGKKFQLQIFGGLPRGYGDLQSREALLQTLGAERVRHLEVLVLSKSARFNRRALRDRERATLFPGGPDAEETLPGP